MFRPPFFERPVELRPAPRSLSFTAWVALLLGGGKQIVWFVALAFVPFLWIFVIDSESVSSLYFRGQLERTSGVVTSVQMTNASENKRRISAVDFDYSVDGRALHGRSYTPAQTPTVSSKVDVEYVPASPKMARIVGLRARRFGASGILPFLFAIPLTLPWILMIRGFRDARLLALGKFVRARIVSRRETNTRINRQPVLRYTFEARVSEEATGTYRAWGLRERVYRFDVKSVANAKLQDEVYEPAVVDPRVVGRGLALDALPITITSGGDVDAPSRVLVFFLLPALFLALNVAFFLWP